MFGRLKDWRRVATRYDRSPTVFLSVIALAATVLFWLSHPEPRPMRLLSSLIQVARRGLGDGAAFRHARGTE